MVEKLTYLQGYQATIVEQAQRLLEQKKLASYLLSRYPNCHDVSTDKALYRFVQDLKSRYVKQSSPINKVVFDDKIHAINNALGTHTFISRKQGNKLKSKNEIRIAKVFKKAPLEFLTMIVVHELAHVKEKDHNKAFYKLCQHMEPNYFQLELDLRLYLTQLEQVGELYS